MLKPKKQLSLQFQNQTYTRVPWLHGHVTLLRTVSRETNSKLVDRNCFQLEKKKIACKAEGNTAMAQSPPVA